MAGSLGENTPVRDLWVSPKHAIFLEGVLIEAEHLVNSVNITQPRPTNDAPDFHIELQTHDVLVADGAAAATFVDDGGRCMFHNAASCHQLYPTERPREVTFRAPRVEDGYIFDEAVRRLNRRAGLQIAA